MQTSSGSKLHPLTSLRFFAALGVAIAHGVAFFQLPITPSSPINWASGVSFFFVLSGFLLTYVYDCRGKLELGRYVVARVARIWPAHIAALIIYLTVIPVVYWKDIGWEIWVTHLTLTQSWLPQFKLNPYFTEVSWSVSVEFAFYICFPFFLKTLHRYWKWQLLLGLLLAVISIILGNVFAGQQLQYIYFFPAARFHEFLMGMSTALFWQHWGSRLRKGVIVGTLIETFVLLLVLFFLWRAYFWGVQCRSWVGSAGVGWVVNSGFLAPVFSILIFVMALGRGLWSKLLSWRPLLILGEISYSTYLLHIIPIYFLGRSPGKYTILKGWAGFWLYFIAVQAAAFLVWAFIEKPCRAYIINWWARRQTLQQENSHREVSIPHSRAHTRKNEEWIHSWRSLAVGISIFLTAVCSSWFLQTQVLKAEEEALPPITSYVGYFDVSDCEKIAGWVWCPQRAGRSLEVEVFDGDKLINTLEASVPRLDLVQVTGSANHGFVCETPKSLKDGKPHLIHVRVKGTDFSLTGSPHTFICK